MFRKTLIFTGLFLALGINCFAADQTAKVIIVKGDVKVIPNGRNIGIECADGRVLQTGDWIKTGNNSSVKIAFDEGRENVVTVKENTLLIIKLDGYYKIKLLSGKIFAILEDVKQNETFRVLTPSVVAESESSGWGASTDGTYTNVVVFDNKVMVCGLNKDGSPKQKKVWIKQGFQRKTINFEDPGELSPAPESLVNWFRDLVIAHHLEENISAKGLSDKTETPKSNDVQNSKVLEEKTFGNDDIKEVKTGKVDILDYIYQKRLGSRPGLKYKDQS